jgi:hypothetical protein
MLNRFLPMFLVVVAVAAFVALQAPAQNAKGQDKDQTHEGKIVKITKDELVMTDKAGKEHTHKLTAATKLRLDNKDVQAADIGDFKKDMKVRVSINATTKAVTKVEALSTGDFKD